MVINSFLGSNTRFSSSPFTTRNVGQLIHDGVSVDFRERSYWQSPIASTHSSNTSLRIFFRKLLQRRLHIRINDLHPHQKILKCTADRRVQVVDILIDCGKNILAAQIGGCNDAFRAVSNSDAMAFL